jgi:protein-S-isoprenylcysteine O-methyltransferase Ste14
MNYLFISIYVAWFASEIYWNRKLRAKKTDNKSLDKKTEILIWITIPIAIFFAVLVSVFQLGRIFSNSKFGIIGLIIILLGMLLRFLAIKQLGQFFTVDVTIKSNHKIIDTGFYKNLRHPSYAASLLSMLGMGISQNSYWSVLIMLLLGMLAFLVRINIEEKALVENFGKQYLDYAQKTKKLIPFVY